MKKTAIKMKTYATNVNIVNNNNLQIRVFHFLAVSLCVLALSYAIVMGITVFNIVERQNLGTQAKDLSNEVGSLELEYLSLSNKIDVALSQEMGFKEVKKVYATRKTLSAVAFSTNEF